jgi:hypothetical protein
MRQFPILIMTFLFGRCYGQTQAVKVFKKTEYINGIFYRELYDTLKIENKKIDIYFFEKNFHSPYYLPDKFIDKGYKNKTVSVWREPKAKRDHQFNWENTYTYDSVGRVIKYTYSGCLICSNLPYNYIVTYNSLSQVDNIKNTMSGKDSYKFYYSSTGDIKQFDHYSLDELKKTIIVIE